MEAHIDSYTQMAVRFTKEEILQLDQTGKLSGKIWRSEPNRHQYQLPFKVSKAPSVLETKARGLPVRQPWEGKTSYELAIPQETINVLKRHKEVGFDFTSRGVMLRSVFLGFEGQY